MRRNNNGNSNKTAANKKDPTPEAAADDKRSVKVKYISSPVLVEAQNPSQFKQIVQHFTGQSPNEVTTYDDMCSMYSMYSMNSSPTDMVGTRNAVAAAAAAETGTGDRSSYDQIYGYDQSGNNMGSVEGGIDGYSWEEIAEWNRNR